MDKMPKPKTTPDRYNGPVHAWFNLSYGSYYVAPRLALQSMPIWWQRIFIWLIDMLPPAPGDYQVSLRDRRGVFMHDPWADYRKGDVQELMEADNDEENI
jgi:hypothetical protein